ncbi:MAG: ATP-binding protein [Bacteroidota bacterium]|nr:ATP-binding protein [Bacteroidota bacterium]
MIKTFQKNIRQLNANSTLLVFALASIMVLGMRSLYQGSNMTVYIFVWTSILLVFVYFLINSIHKEKVKLNQQNDPYLEKSILLDKRYTFIAQSAGIGTWDWDLHTNRLKWDKVNMELHDIKSNQAFPSFEEWNAMVHPDDKSRLANEIRKAISGTQNFDTQFRVILSSGAVKTIKTKGYVSYDENNKPLSMMGVNWDITERKIAEVELKKSHLQNKGILNSMSSQIALINAKGEIIATNEAWDRYIEQTGLQKLAEANSPINYLSLCQASYQHGNLHSKEILEGIEQVFKGNLQEFETEYICNTPTENKWLSLKATKFYDTEDWVVMVVNDISSIKLAAIEKERITRDLIQRNKNIEQFSYIVSHNLRAPLTNIIGCVELIKNDEINATELKKIIEGMASSANKLDDVIKDLNQILQVRNPLIEKREAVSFHQIVDEIKDTIQESIQQNKVSFTTDFNEVEELVSIKRYIYSIFYNLIYNSIKYQNPQVNPVIEIKSKRLDNGIKLTFKDNGSGIDLIKEHDKIFGLYKRFHLDIEGKGIGLFMVKNQVETIGGTIHIASEPNKGTEFTIELPV